MNLIVQPKNQKVRKYELTILFLQSIVEDPKSTFGSLFSIFSHLSIDQFQIISIQDISRFEIFYKKKEVKINLLSFVFEVKPWFLYLLKNKITSLDSKEKILKYLLVKSENKIIKNFLDYKKPIGLKKYLFESQRIMPRQLTNIKKKTQRILALNIKRARTLGLLSSVTRMQKNSL